MSPARLRVVIDEKLPASFPTSHLEGRVQFEPASTKEALEEAVRGSDVLYSGRVPDIVPAETPRLRWIQLPSAGADDLLDHPVWTSDVVITASKGIHTIPMTEQLFAMLLGLVRQIPATIRAQDRHEWIHDWAESRLSYDELHGKTLGILGWGHIGDGVAHLARAFGMRVIGTRSSVTEPHEVGRDVGPFTNPPWVEPVTLEPDMVYPATRLHDVLSRSDVVVSILPLTDSTRHAMNGAAFDAVKPGALFCNMGRGGTVDEAALIRALQTGRLGGAGLDVFGEEPLPASSPLWSMPNVIVGPHVGGMSDHRHERTARFFAVNLERYLEGQPLLNVVDRGRGY